MKTITQYQPNENTIPKLPKVGEIYLWQNNLKFVVKEVRKNNSKNSGGYRIYYYYFHNDGRFGINHMYFNCWKGQVEVKNIKEIIFS